LAVTFILIPIGFFAFRSIWKGWRGGSRGESRRRQVGILWDLGSFWPRWHHPFSPPGYGPKAVKDLTLLVDSMPEDGVMGAHSQGSLIGAIAITRAKHGVGFLTYGSQLGLLYPRMFPNVGIPNLVEAVATRVGGRWQNLWRRTDPIGGHFVTHDGVRNIEVTEGNGHSGHEITGAYSKARREVSGLGEDPVC
jgi:hypothetical protein